MENARNFDPPDPRMIDMSPRGMMASTSRTMPTDRMSAVNIIVSKTNPDTTSRIRFAFSQFLELFQGQSSKSEVISELFWASLHGIAELTRTKRFPPSRQKRAREGARRALHFPKMKRHRW